jgi:HD-like signal output (HDOD) protein/ActR/RegA family two-component response regulator
MAQKTILLAVADPQALADITQALGAEWEPTPVSSEAEALTQLDERPFDALLADFNLGAPDASELLNEALEKRPETVRFLLSYEADLALVAAKVQGPHHILPKPSEGAAVKARLESALADPASTGVAGATIPPAAEDPGPAIPPIYAEVLTALESAEATTQQVGELISRDAALTSELLSLTHSAYLGARRNLNDPVEVVGALGLQTVRGLVMARKFLAEHSNLRPGYLSLEDLWQHSVHVAKLARDLILFETRDRALASAALLAGLVHDLGKVVLVTNFDDLYGRVHSLGRKQPVPLWDIEKEIFGATHGEIGGCLVGMWNLPRSIVDAAAFHHEPPLGEGAGLTPLAVVHIANALEHEMRPSEEGFVEPKISTAFIEELRLLKRLPVWRAAIGKWSLADPGPKPKRSATALPAGIPPVPSLPPPPPSAHRAVPPAAATQTATSQPSPVGRPLSFFLVSRQRGWVYAGAAAGLVLLLALWVQIHREPTSPEPVYARTHVPGPGPVPLSPAPPVEPAPAPATVLPAEAASVPVVTPSAVPHHAVSQQEPANINPLAATLAAPISSTPKPPPPPAVTEPAPRTNLVHAPVPAAEKRAPDFRLNGIMYSTTHPWAIVNGQTVAVGDRVNGARVLEIGRASVILQVGARRITCKLN